MQNRRALLASSTGMRLARKPGQLADTIAAENLRWSKLARDAKITMQ